MSGTVYLVGAGCGGAEFLTRRAEELIRSANVIVCDALVDESVVALFPPEAEVMFVGKRAHVPSPAQDDINKLLIEKSRTCTHVVRLKGGDPFVFGRGGEEVLALADAGILTEVVPGISSALAAPALAGIPLTHRDLARSFHVVTAHGSDGPRDLGAYARLDGTLVILMGFSRLREIASELTDAGRDGVTPVAVVSQGATPRQRVVRGTLLTIADLSDAAHLEAPAVIVVGETAALDLSSRVARPLDGARVALVGTDSFVSKLAAKLRRVGAETKHVCRLALEPLDWKVPEFARYTWLVLTSPNGVKVLFDKLRETRTDVRTLPTQIAVVGPGTADALASYGVYPTLIPAASTAAALGEKLASVVKPDERVLILRAAQGRAELLRPLVEAGLLFDETAIYDVRPLTEKVLSSVDADYLVFASGSGVRAFFETKRTIDSTVRVVAFGETAARALKEKGISVCRPDWCFF